MESMGQMESIDQIQERIVGDFLEMGDAFDQYALLIEIAGMLPPMPEELKTDDRLVEGCQSRVWLQVDAPDGLLSIAADSDTFIVKGILKLLEDVFCGQRPEDVAKAEVTFLEKTQITETFESARQKGIGYVIRQIQREAAELSA